MRLGDEFVLDPIHITGEGPRKRGIFADTSWDELFGKDSPGTEPGMRSLLLLAVLATGIYLAAKK